MSLINCIKYQEYPQKWSWGKCIGPFNPEGYQGLLSIMHIIFGSHAKFHDSDKCLVPGTWNPEFVDNIAQIQRNVLIKAIWTMDKWSTQMIRKENDGHLMSLFTDPASFIHMNY